MSPEINERGEWYGFDPKKKHPVDDDPDHFIINKFAASLRKLEERGINSDEIDEMKNEATLNQYGGWHWGDGTKSSHAYDASGAPSVASESVDVTTKLSSNGRADEDEEDEEGHVH